MILKRKMMGRAALSGLEIMSMHSFLDQRGGIYKPFTLKSKPDFKVEEVLFAVSAKNVIRGMHYQTPPYQQRKLIFVSSGSILDVVLDLRKESKTFGHFDCVKLGALDRKAILIPSGCAHGYLSLEENTCVHYIQSGQYSPEHERGIRFDSFGMDWGVPSPVLSEKDRLLPSLSEILEREAR